VGWPISIASRARRRQGWVRCWCGRQPRGKLLRLDRTGQWTPVAAWDNSCPGNLTRQANGRPAYSDHCRGVVGRIDARDRVVEQKLPAGTYIQQLAAAPDGSLWFSGDEKGRLGRVDRDGRLTYLARRADDQTMAVLVTRRGEVVFSEFYNYNINRLTLAGDYVEHLVNVTSARTSARCAKARSATCASRRASRQRPRWTKSAPPRCAAAVSRRTGRAPRNWSRKNAWPATTPAGCCSPGAATGRRASSACTPTATIRGAGALSPEDTARIVTYFNTYYGLSR
jgi:hypothetical protein